MLTRFLTWLMGSPDLEARMTVIAQQDAEQEEARAELIKWLADANRHAKRQPCVIEKFMDDKPTKWSAAHHDLDDLLDQLEATR